MSARRPTAYLDTNLIIGLAEDDLAPAEMAGLDDLLDRRDGGEIGLFKSHVAKEELGRRASASGGGRVRRVIDALLHVFRRQNRPDTSRLQSVIYRLLDTVSVMKEVRLGAGPIGSHAIGTPGPLIKDELLQKLSAVVPGENDARHIFQAASNGIDYFVTCDRRTILKHAQAIEAVAGIKARSPSELAAELAATASSP